MFKPGQKIRCIDAAGTWLVYGRIYTCERMYERHGRWFVSVAEYPNKSDCDGWYPERFKEDEDADYVRFMEHVMKPVNLDSPVTA